MASKSSVPPAKSPAVPSQNPRPQANASAKPKTEKKEKDEVEKVVESFFTPVLEKLINDIIRMVDPLDMQKFNSVEYVNMLFPNEQSLVDLDTAISTMKLKMALTDEEILRAVRDQVISGAKGTQDLFEAQKGIKELTTKMVDIKTKASQAETMVTEISKDIQSLDFSKKNLTATITDLKRFQMLVNAVDQLKETAATKQYRTAGNLLQAVAELIEHFINFKHIERVGNIVKNVNDIRAQLLKQIYEEFTKYHEDATATPDNTFLLDACVVVEALGKEQKRDFMIWFCNLMLTEYNKFFQPNDESGHLDQVERRFSWLKKVLLLYDEKYMGVFPKEWKMAELVCEEFCFTTRQHFADILEAQRKSLDVKILVSTITKSIAFEKELADRFGSVEVIEQDNTKPEEDSEPKKAENEVHSMSVDAVKARYQKFVEQQRKKTESEKKKRRQVSKFKGIISSGFDLYMDLYINKEDLNMQAALAKALGDETWRVDDDERSKVLTSVGLLVEHIRTSMKTCGKLTKNQPFFDLHNVIKKYLRDYILSIGKRISTSDEKVTCLVINTLDYCYQMMNGIQSSFKKSINPKFVDQVDFSNETNECDNVISRGLKTLVTTMMNKVEPSLTQMARMPWATMESVGDTSDYVNQMQTPAQQCASTYAANLMNSVHFNFVLDSFCKESFIPTLIQYVYRCRKINDVGAQQLMLDFTAIKGALLDLPNTPGKNNQPSRQYIKIIQKGMGRAETIVKLIGFTPANSLVASIKNMLPDATENDITKICELKGIAKADVKSYIDQIAPVAHEKPEKNEKTDVAKASTTISSPTAPSYKASFNKIISDVSSMTQRLTSKTSSKQ